jgi:hypothetical protein
MDTVLFEFKIDSKTWSSLVAEKERIELAGMINIALREAGVGWWTGSSLKGTSLVFFCMVNDEIVARHKLLKELRGHPLIRFLV